MNAPAMYQVICDGHGIPGARSCGVVPLTEQEYVWQLERPDAPWQCPRCGASAQWDDDSLVTSEPDEVEGDDDEFERRYAGEHPDDDYLGRPR